jgi:alpha-glucosidase
MGNKSNIASKAQRLPLAEMKQWAESVYTDISSDCVCISNVDDVLQIQIRIHISSDLDIKDAVLYFHKCGDEMRIPLTKNIVGRQDEWTVSVKLENVTMLNPFLYRFKLNALNGDSVFYDADGISKYKVSTISNFKYYHQSAPTWLNSAVVYHIFVDSFCKASISKTTTIRWGSTHPRDIHSLYGGDIAGIRSRLDYLCDLGVTVLCLTPIFQSSTNHRYDVEDYFSVDDRLGGNEEFVLLCQECKKRNLKVVLDGVFNHMSSRSPWFNKYGLHLNTGAYQSTDSPYFEHFCFRSHPEGYETFWTDKDLPKLDYRSNSLRNIIYRDENSIIKYWLKEPYCIDGWRLDASCLIARYLEDDLNSEVISELYTEAKKINNESYIFCENPFDPTEVTPYRNGDGITNYAGFYNPLLYWLDDAVNFDADDMDKSLRDFRSLVGQQFTLSSKIFFGNHDKQRLLSILNGNIDKYFTALALLFTYPGVPCIYYGDEIGLHDMSISNDSRMSMKWDGLDPSAQAILDYTKTLITLYKNNKAISVGSFNTLHTFDNTFIYERTCGNDIVIMVLTNSNFTNEHIMFRSTSLERLLISRLYSCLDNSLEISIIDQASVIIGNIKSGKPIMLSSSNPFVIHKPNSLGA